MYYVKPGFKGKPSEQQEHVHHLQSPGAGIWSHPTSLLAILGHLWALLFTAWHRFRSLHLITQCFHHDSPDIFKQSSTSPLPLNKRRNIEPVNHSFQRWEHAANGTYNTGYLKSSQGSGGAKWAHGHSTSGASSFPWHLWKCCDCFLSGVTPKANAERREGVYS